MIRLVHHGFGDERWILDALNRTDGAGLAAWSVHDGGIEFDDAVFVGKAAVADGIVIGVVFYFCDDCESGVERVATGFEDGHSVIEIMKAVGGGNDERTSTLRRGENVARERRRGAEEARGGGGAVRP